jgi:hypothetical protein
LIHFVSVRVGAKYGPEYVHILHDMLARNASTEEHAHYCVTDDPGSLPSGVNYIPHNPDLPGWWQKLSLFDASRMPWAEGDRIAYFDLDVAITGRLEDLPKGIIKDWAWPCYNSSVMVWDHGEHSKIWDSFDPSVIDRPSRLIPAGVLPKGQVNGGDQEWITEVGRWPIFPEDMFQSYRWGSKDWPHHGCKAVIFHGSTKPADITEGWVTDVWKVGGFTSLPVMKGINVTHDAILENVRSSVQRPLTWFRGAYPHSKTAVMVCGGPSMKNDLKAIRDHKRRGATIFTVNNAHRFLIDNGIMPDAHVMLDARTDNAKFVSEGPECPRYFIASQCAPEVFDALEGREVTLWHNAIGDGSDLEEIAKPYETDDNPLIPIPGGCTVGLRGIWLAFFSGYRKLHIYGMDSSYADDGAHHAYGQPLNDSDEAMEVALNGKRYRCAKWMARQADEFQQTWRDVAEHGMTLFVHGFGLVPDMAKALKAKP